MLKQLIISASLFATGAASAATQTITMKSISYDPKQITITVGDSLEWVNKSYTPHSATADDGKLFDTGMVAPQKKSKAIAFKEPGVYAYHCTMHGKTMSGEITVKAKP